MHSTLWSTAASFVLIAGEDGKPWVDAAHELAERHGIDLVAVRVGVLEGDYIDARCAWTKQRKIGRQGAVLVRPDRHIGFRSVSAVRRHKDVLDGALRQILHLH